MSRTLASSSTWSTALLSAHTRPKSRPSTDLYEDKDLTLGIVAVLYSKAAKISCKKHPGIPDALEASTPPRPDPKPAKPQVDDAKPKGKANGKGGQGDAAAKPRQPTAAQPTPAGGLINPTAHVPLSEIRTLRETWRKSRACLNCGQAGEDSSPFPRHSTGQCP